MADTIILDTKNYKKAMDWYEFIGPKKLIPAVVRGYVNDMAFEIKDTSKKTMDKVFDYKSARTRKYIESAVVVKKAVLSATITSIEAVVGVRSGGEETRKFYKREIAARQEKGGILKQIKSSGTGFRSQLIAPARGQDSKKTIRFRKAGLVRGSKKITNPKRRMAAALKVARQKKKKYASTPYGIYKVLKSRAFAVRVYKPEKSIHTKASPWLKPANNLSMRKRDKLFKKNLNRQLKKHELK